MPVIAKDVRGGFTPAPEGLHHAVCCDVVDLGDVETSFGTKHMIKIVWQLPDEIIPGKGLPFIVQARYNCTLNEKANLRRVLESWRGVRFTAQEIQGFDVERLVGVNCQVTVVHNHKDGQTYANVMSVVPIGRGMTKKDVVGYERVKDRPDYEPPVDEEREAAESSRPPVEEFSGSAVDDDVPF